MENQKIKIQVEVSFRTGKNKEVIVSYQNGDSFEIITPDGLGKLGFPDEVMKEAYKFRASLLGGPVDFEEYEYEQNMDTRLS